MDAALFRRVKLEAARQGRPLAEILEDALNAYFVGGRPPAQKAGSLVEASWGAMAAAPDLVREIMDDEDDWLES